MYLKNQEKENPQKNTEHNSAIRSASGLDWETAAPTR